MKNAMALTATLLSAACGGASLAAEPTQPTSGPVVVKVDVSKSLGPVKPVNGIGQPPTQALAGHNMYKYLREAGIPFSRLHDVCWPYGASVLVDVPNIFRKFDADENDPANYDFAFTDRMLKDLVGYGVKPFYRLGVSSEPNNAIKAYRVYPPKDFEKWARICEHIIEHYNGGGTNGYEYGIDHWEIWNGPDQGDVMWKGSFEEYIQLYVTTAKALKKRFPDIKVGGFASGGLQGAAGDSDEQAQYKLACLKKFLAAVKKEGAPLDFVTFISFSELDEVLAQVAAGRKLLDEAGFPGVEMCLAAWQTERRREIVGTARHCAMIGASLLSFQASALDSAAIFDGRAWAGPVSPLFSGTYACPRKAYYAYCAFNELRKLGTAVEATSSHPGVYVGAAAKDGKVAVMIANTTAERFPYELDIGGDLPAECHLTNDGNNYRKVKFPKTLPPYSVISFTK